MPTFRTITFDANIDELVFVVAWEQTVITCRLCRNGTRYGHTQHAGVKVTAVSLLDHTLIPCPRCGGDGKQYAHEWRVSSGKVVRLSFYDGGGVTDGNKGKPCYYVDVGFGNMGRFHTYDRVFPTHEAAEAALPAIKKQREKYHPLNKA